MPIYYLDTSALVKRYRAEQGTQTINELLDGQQDVEEIITSFLGSLEVEAVAARLLRGRVLNTRAYRRILGLLASDVANRVMLHPASPSILEASIDLIRLHA